MHPGWTDLSDEMLLGVRICDLGIAIAGSELEPRIAQLHAELEARGITARPECYLGDEWFSPEDAPLIAIPFYLAHPRLKTLEQAMMMEVEGGDSVSCQRLLRHECGHAIEHAYRLHTRRRRKELFGPRTADYDPDTYRPHPYSRSHVRHLPNWYAQAHPDEDWAETFAVWLDPESDWRKRYVGWKALAKLEYVDEVMKEIAGKPPLVKRGRREYDATRIRATLGSFYKRRRKLYATDSPDFYDADLRALFAPGADERAKASAAVFMRRHRKTLVDTVSKWTEERKVTIDLLVRKLVERAEKLSLTVGREADRTSMDIAAWLATLVTHYRFTGKFKRSV